jgi:hypothetical protein
LTGLRTLIHDHGLLLKQFPQSFFDDWLDTIPSVWKVAYELEGGKVVLYGDPKTHHARTTGWFLSEFIGEINRFKRSLIFQQMKTMIFLDMASKY